MLEQWAARWGIAPAAILELRTQLGIAGLPQLQISGNMGSEVRQQSLVRIDAAEKGITLFRNNVGALLDERGVPVRYGLANESKAQNQLVKSADLIGLRPVLIGPHHVGQLIGQFVSREVKHQGWQYSGDKHEVAQLNWCNFVLSKGGDAAFCSGPGSFNR